jgi:hypothetical protein
MVAFRFPSPKRYDSVIIRFTRSADNGACCCGGLGCFVCRVALAARGVEGLGNADHNLHDA